MLRIWDSCLGEQTRLQSDGGLDVGQEDDEQQCRRETHKVQKTIGQISIMPLNAHLDHFQHLYREWNAEAGDLTHEAKREGSSWNTYHGEAKIEGHQDLFLMEELVMLTTIG